MTDTLRFTVDGSTYDDLVKAADTEIERLMAGRLHDALIVRIDADATEAKAADGTTYFRAYHANVTLAVQPGAL
jgi:hypothetical protein